jgi:hypothetical protein
VTLGACRIHWACLASAAGWLSQSVLSLDSLCLGPVFWGIELWVLLRAAGVQLRHCNPPVQLHLAITTATLPFPCVHRGTQISSDLAIPPGSSLPCLRVQNLGLGLLSTPLSSLPYICVTNLRLVPSPHPFRDSLLAYSPLIP